MVVHSSAKAEEFVRFKLESLNYLLTKTMEKSIMKSAKLKSMTVKAKARRRIALQQLENQLLLGIKPNRGTTAEKKLTPSIPLEEKDVKRIKKEIETLKTRI
jgi:hypothetical protein